jgi:hypothetical protein
MAYETQIDATNVRVASALEDVSEWENLSVTPDIIVIIGEAMVVGSVPSAAAVRFTDDDLR